MEISVWFPELAIESQPAGGGGKMDMEIAFKITAESVDSGIDAGDEMFLSGDVFNNLGQDKRNFIEKPAVEPEERLKLSRQGESDVLPNGVWESVKSGFDPVVGGLFSAGGTETGFAGMRCLDLAETFGADKHMPTEKRSSAGKHFKHIDNNVFTDQLAVGEKEFPPVAVINEDVPDFDLTANEFHKLNVPNLTSEESKSCPPIPIGWA